MQQRNWLQSQIHHGSSVLTAVVLLAFPAVVVADQLSDVVALEAQCAQDREARIKPLRDMEIAKCKADDHNDAAYCERYWKDYGNSTRISNGGMTPRMFDDLPVCVAAFEARKALINRDGN
jgi:hypothetical protein